MPFTSFDSLGQGSTLTLLYSSLVPLLCLSLNSHTIALCSCSPHSIELIPTYLLSLHLWTRYLDVASHISNLSYLLEQIDYCMKLLITMIFIPSSWKHNNIFEVEITITPIPKYCFHNSLKDSFTVNQIKKKQQQQGIMFSTSFVPHTQSVNNSDLFFLPSICLIHLFLDSYYYHLDLQAVFKTMPSS